MKFLDITLGQMMDLCAKRVSCSSGNLEKGLAMAMVYDCPFYNICYRIGGITPEHFKVAFGNPDVDFDKVVERYGEAKEGF